MEDLIYFALIMLNRIGPQDPLDHVVTRPIAAVVTTLAQPKPSDAPPTKPKLDVAIDQLEANPEPPIATETKKKRKKKAKKN